MSVSGSLDHERTYRANHQATQRQDIRICGQEPGAVLLRRARRPLRLAGPTRLIPSGYSVSTFSSCAQSVSSTVSRSLSSTLHPQGTEEGVGLLRRRARGKGMLGGSAPKLPMVVPSLTPPTAGRKTVLLFLSPATERALLDQRDATKSSAEIPASVLGSPSTPDSASLSPWPLTTQAEKCSSSS